MKKGRKKISKKVKIILMLCAVAVVFAAIALIVHHTTKITNESYENCSVGDVNGDGFINSSDSLLVIQSTGDDSLLFENQKKLADVNSDGIVNSEDALILLRFTVGEIKRIPYVQNKEEESDKTKNSRYAEAEGETTFSTAQIMNEWDNGDGTHSYQVNVSVKNTSDDDVSGWNTTVLFDKPVNLTKNWDCKCRVNSDEVIVRGDPISKESAAVCGFIVTVSDGTSILSISTKD